MRLDKYLSDAGCGTRSEVKKIIKTNNVTVNDVLVIKPEQQVTYSDVVFVSGRLIKLYQYVYYMLNKPKDVVSATSDNTCKTVIDILNRDSINRPVLKGVFPVGRLDKDTEGLLLLTNDGELAHRLLAPGKHVDKTYYSRIDGEVNEFDVISFKEGIDIGEKKESLPAELEILSYARDGDKIITEVKVTIHEGKFHQIKRMFQACGKRVVYLKRLSMGSLELDKNLRPGEWRSLTDVEIEKL